MTDTKTTQKTDPDTLDFEPSIRTWKTSDGLEIHCRIWDIPDPVADVWIVHGLGDHGGRYLHVAESLAAAGFRVIAADQRGCGLSEGKRGYVPRFESLLEDLEQTLDETALAGQKKVLVGQSLGGLIVARFLETFQMDLDAAVIMSPMFRTTRPAPWLKLALARLLRRIWPGLTLRAGIRSSDLTSSESERKEYRKDPLKHDWVSAELGLAMFEQGELAIDEADRIRNPVLVMHGDKDMITSPAASEEFARANPLIELKIWSGKKHELHHETSSQAVLGWMIDWLREKVGLGKRGNP